MTDNPAIEAMGEFIQEKSVAYALGNDCATVRELGLAGIEHLAAAGFAVVPVEPTEAMVDAGVKAFVEGGGVYRAMIAAAKGEG